MHRHLSGWRGILILIPSILVWSACSNEPTGAVQPTIAPEAMLLRIEADPRGIVLAVGDSQQITIQAWNILGDPLPIDDSIPATYTSANASRVAISPTGVVRGMNVTQSPTAAPAPVRVIVRWKYGSITRADSIYVLVTQRPVQPIVAMSIQPSPYPIDSTWVGIWGSKNLAVKGFTATGDSVTNLYAYLYTEQRRRFLNDWVAPSSRAVGGAFSPAVFWIYATVSMYGIALQDSLQFTQIDPIHNIIFPFRFTLNSSGDITTTFANGGTWFFSPCADIVFDNGSTVPLTITFDDPSKTDVCVTGDQTGNITLTAAGTLGARATRKFRTAGLYHWTATRTDGVPFRVPPVGHLLVRDHTFWNALP